MARLLARTVAHLWRHRLTDATVVELHHVDPGREPIRQEIVTRLGQAALALGITNDVALGRAGRRALAEELDAQQHQACRPPRSTSRGRSSMHTLAFNEPLKA